jgi:hypothetical protein
MERVRQIQQHMSALLTSPARADALHGEEIQKETDPTTGTGRPNNIPDKNVQMNQPSSSDDQKGMQTTLVSSTNHNEIVSSVVKDEEAREELRKRPGTVIVPCRGEC